MRFKITIAVIPNNLILRLFDWRPEKKLEPATRPKNEKVVVLKNMFSPKEFEVSDIYYIMSVLKPMAKQNF